MLPVILRKPLVAFICAAILLLASGCGVSIPSGITGSGKAETRDFTLSDFTGIQAANTFSVQVNRADSFKVQVTADDNLWDSLDISTSGNILHLRAKPGTSIANATLKASVTLPSINSLDLSGASTATLSDFNAENSLNSILSGASTANFNNVKAGPATFDISGASNVTGNLTATTLKFTASGASKTNLGGSGTDINIDSSGGSSITLDQFKAQNATVSLSGGSQARVNVQNITSADLSGGSNLYYIGSPSIGKVQTSGGSSLHQE